jgi:hypothetical protein
MLTVDLGATTVPEGGLCASTAFGSMQRLKNETLGTRPNAVIARIALLCKSESKSGTITPPVDAAKFTSEPGNSMMPAGGFCEITDPAGAVLRL